ncbi:MAG: hypothetical protein WA964_07470 [Ilumatobacter sp.]|uniref:hypothetical protein n=1 Tax=Ilumatobacter sp. TaxID=1967498 RepID=UPI003C73AABB
MTFPDLAIDEPSASPEVPSRRTESFTPPDPSLRSSARRRRASARRTTPLGGVLARMAGVLGRTRPWLLPKPVDRTAVAAQTRRSAAAHGVSMRRRDDPNP